MTRVVESPHFQFAYVLVTSLPQSARLSMDNGFEVTGRPPYQISPNEMNQYLPDQQPSKLRFVRLGRVL